MRRLLFFAVVLCGSCLAQDAAKSANDPVLRAMLDELQRSKTKLKLADVDDLITLNTA